MTEDELIYVIEELKKQGDEIPWIEAKDSLGDIIKIGETISALANSASWKDREYGYLIWGLEDKTWDMIGTSFRLKKKKQGNQDAILWLLNSALNKKCFEVFDFEIDNKEIQVLKILNCENLPVQFQNKAWIRINSHNQELSKYPDIERLIWSKKFNYDWSAEVCKNATIEDLDPGAVQELRERLFKVKNNQEFITQPLQNILNRVNLLTDNQINNTCLIFLGKPEITDRVLFDKNKISWVYRDELNGIEERLNLDEIKKPFILLIPEIQKQINRFNTYLKDLDIFRDDIRQYDGKAIEEVLVNAIAHRDWEIPVWIEVVQTPVSLEFRNPGRFAANWERVLDFNEKPPYKNPNLVSFLNHINLMEREGDGLRKVFKAQISKGLQVTQRSVVPDRVDIILSGKVKNMEFAKSVLNRHDLNITQLRVLEKIAEGQNKLNQDITTRESNLVKDLVELSTRGGYLRIKKHILQTGGVYEKEFAYKHSSGKGMRQIILDFARKNNREFSTAQMYDVFSGKSRDIVRQTLSQMIKEGSIVRIKKGYYKTSQ